ncbi:hypothetical protein ACHAQI_007475 [Fusarium lateritium]
MFPQPQGFDPNAVTIAAIAAGMPMLGQLPPELVVAIQSHCPDRPFWRLVRIHALKLRLERLPDYGEQSETHLSALVFWKRGDFTPLCSTVLSNTERLRITVDSDGIYEIKRLSEHVHPTRLLKRHLERYIIANAGQLKSVRAFFKSQNLTMKDGLCWLLCTIYHPGFTIWDTSAPPQALELSSATSNGRQNFPKIIGFNECDMVPDFIPRNFSIETIDITASHITGISFRFYTLDDWQKFDVFVHTESDKPSSHAKPDTLVFMPLPANDEILWLQVETKLSGVIHLGSQENANSLVKAFSQRPQLMLCNDDLCEDNFHWPIAFYPKGAPNDPQALSIITGPRLRHDPASTHLLWSWAPLEHIDNVSVYDEQNRNFRGMHIVYKNGGERFVGINQYLGHSTASSYCKAPTHLNVEITARGLIHTTVYFAPTDLKPLPDSEHTQYPLTGELHCWITPLSRAEIRVLPSGSWRRSDVWD